MKTKTDIQKDIDALQRQIDQYTNRRADLIADRNKLSASVDDQTQAIGSAMIDGQDITKASDALSRDRVKLEGINAAIEQIDAWLAEFNQRAAQARVDYARVDFDRLTDEADVLFLQAVEGYRLAYKRLESLEAKFGELAELGSSALVSIDNDDHLRMMQGLQRNLLSAIKAKLTLLDDQVCRRVIAEARLKKEGLV